MGYLSCIVLTISISINISMSITYHALTTSSPTDRGTDGHTLLRSCFVVTTDREDHSLRTRSIYFKALGIWKKVGPSCHRYVLRIYGNKAHKANYASSWWWNDCIMMWLHEIRLEYLLLQLVAQKWWFSLFFMKASPTNQRTDGPTNGRTDGRTDRPSYIDLKIVHRVPRVWWGS